VGVGAVRALAGDRRPELDVRTVHLGRLLAAAAAVALLLAGWSQLDAFRDPFAPWQEDASLLLASQWGERWVWALTFAMGTLAAFSVRRLRPAAIPLSILLAGYPALSGHAAAVEGWTRAAMLSDWAHVLAAGAWMGALGVLLLAGRGSSPGAAPLVAFLPRFSALARWSVAILVVTGGWASWLHLDGPGSFLAHPYGRVLGAKILLVAGLLALGAWNWRVLSPRIGTDDGPRRLLAAARWEAMAGVAVLVLTGWLTGMAPPP